MKIKLYCTIRAAALSAAAASIFVCSAAARADVVDAHWNNSAGGNWFTGGNWTPGTVPQNGSPSGTTYNAIIDAAGTYTITQNQAVTLDSLTLDSAGARLEAGTLTTPTLNLQAGTLYLNSELVGARITAGPTGARLFGGTLNRVTIASDILLNKTNFKNGLSLDNAVLQFSDFSTVPQLVFSGMQTISGNGTIVLDSGSSNVLVGLVTRNGTVTIGPSVTVKTGQSNGTYTLAIGDGTSAWLNQGTISCQSASRTLWLGGDWKNQGVIKLSAGFLGIDNFDPARLGTFQRSGGALTIGSLSSAMNGASFNTGIFHGAVTWTGGLNGGTLYASADSPITFNTPFPGPSVQNATISGPGVSVRNADMNNVTFTSGTMVNVSGTLNFGTTSAPTALVAGNIRLSGGTFTAMGPSLTIGPDAELGGYGLVRVTTSTTSSGELFNNGTIRALPGSQPLVIPNIRNAGQVIAEDGACLSLNGDLNPTYLGQHRALGTGSVLLYGTFDNSGNTLKLDGPEQSLWFSGTFSGGTVSGSNGGVVYARPNGSVQTFSGVILDTDVVANADNKSVSLINGTTMTPGHALRLTGNYGSFALGAEFAGDVVCEGKTYLPNTINASTSLHVRDEAGPSGSSSVAQTQNGVVYVETPSAYYYTSSGSTTFTNNGQIVVSDGVFDVAQVLKNNGTIQLSGSGRLALSNVASSLAGLGHIDRVDNGGDISVAGSFTAAPDTQPLNDAIGDWSMYFGAIQGGSIIPLPSGLPLRVSGTFNYFDGTSIDTDVQVLPGSGLYLQNTWANHKTIYANSATISVNGSVRTSDFGSLALSGSTVEVTGTLNNVGQTFPSPAWGTDTIARLRIGTILGGTVGLPGSSVSISNARLDAVTLAGTTSVSAYVHVFNGLSLDNATISLPGSSLFSNGTEWIDGTGTILLGGPSNSAGYLYQSNEGVLTLGPGITVMTSNASGNIGSGGGSGRLIVNQGTVASAMPLRTLSITEHFENDGTVFAQNGGTVSIANALLTNYSSQGSIGTLTGGTWKVFGGSTMTFSSASAKITANRAAVQLDGASSSFVPLNSLSENAGTLTLSSGRNFTTLGALANSGRLNLNASTLKVAGGFANSGSLDLNGSLIVDYSDASPMADLVSQIGTHIFSSDSLNNPAKRIGYAEASELFGTLPATFGGLSVTDNTAALMRLTFGGDGNLDGMVDIVDLGLLAAHWQQAGDWHDGDFNYDGTVDIVDLGLFATNWQAGVGMGAEPTLREALALLDLPDVTVPEPTSLLAATLTASSLLLGRRTCTTRR